jgi:hypothetical protein
MGNGYGRLKDGFDGKLDPRNLACESILSVIVQTHRINDKKVRMVRRHEKIRVVCCIFGHQRTQG